MTALIDVILPVFLIIGFGYLAVWKGYFDSSGVDGLMQFTQTFAIPCLLFRALSTLDLSLVTNLPLLASFYGGVTAGFLAGLLGARYIFGRDWEDSVVIGFCGMFSNTVLLGLPITQRAYGMEATQANFAIIALHAPFGYLVGITAMELVRNRGASLPSLIGKVTRSIFRNALILGIGLGLAVNILGLTTPAVAADALDLIGQAALPAALFGLGGTLFFYRPEGDMRTIIYVVAISLLLHPIVTYFVARGVHLDTSELRSATLTAAMAPGINAYVFANMYGRAKRVAASAVLIATGLSVFTVWLWLAVLP